MTEEHTTLFSKTDVLRMFPTFVWKADLVPAVRQRLDRSILHKLQQLRQAGLSPAPGHGWQSDHDLHTSGEFRELTACVSQAVGEVRDFLKIGQAAFEITGCWANINPPDAVHARHNHPNNFLSGVYYLQTQPGADTINFHDPRPQAGVFKPTVTELTAENTDQVVVRVANGTLLLFPAWLAHSVDANTSDATRISISFNIMFSAYAETMSQPLW